MRKRSMIAALLAILVGTAQAETITARVNGLVCAFCAIGIEKTLKGLPAVDQVHIDLESKIVTINTKPEQTLDDATLMKCIADAGYTVTSITREH
jgi:copper chaperone CopZ